jgi:hypothetical protein
MVPPVDHDYSLLLDIAVTVVVFAWFAWRTP